MHLQIIAKRHTSAKAGQALQYWACAASIASLALGAATAATVLSLATQSPATSKTVSFNDGAESRCIEYTLTSDATRADVADALNAMADSVEAHGCANITFEGF